MEEAPILICYDGSADSDHAIETAANLFGSRRAVVADIGPMLTAAESVAALESVIPGNAFEDLNTDSALEIARAGAERARRAGFDAEARAELSSATWEGIVDVADEIDAAVIVLGSRGLSGIRERLNGSVSHEVAEHSRRPVLIVPPTDER
jgi:nucleotide-binding universal stress UspA family protein